MEQFDNIEIESNFGIIKCYELVFSWNGKLQNIGFWIFLFLVVMHIPLLFSYFCKGINPIKEYIINEMKKHGYISTGNNNKKNNNKTNKKFSLNKKSNPPKKKNKNKKFNGSSINNIKHSEREVIREIISKNNKDNINNINIIYNNQNFNIKKNTKIKKIKSKKRGKLRQNTKKSKNKLLSKKVKKI